MVLVGRSGDRLVFYKKDGKKYLAYKVKVLSMEEVINLIWELYDEMEDREKLNLLGEIDATPNNLPYRMLQVWGVDMTLKWLFPDILEYDGRSFIEINKTIYVLIYDEEVDEKDVEPLINAIDVPTAIMEIID